MSSDDSLGQPGQRKGESYHTVPPRPPASTLSSPPRNQVLASCCPYQATTLQDRDELTEGILHDGKVSGLSTGRTASAGGDGLDTGCGSSSASSSEDDEDNDQGDLSLVGVPVE